FPSDWSLYWSPQSGVHGDRLLGDHPAVVGCEKQHGACDFLPQQHSLDRLPRYHGVDRLLRLEPELLLPLGDHRAGFYRVDADVVDAETAAERTSEADNAGLGRGVGGHVVGAATPGDGREVDDRATAQLLHL